jgi:hypothetical protein
MRDPEVLEVVEVPRFADGDRFGTTSATDGASGDERCPCSSLGSVLTVVARTLDRASCWVTLDASHRSDAARLAST